MKPTSSQLSNNGQPSIYAHLDLHTIACLCDGLSSRWTSEWSALRIFVRKENDF